MGALLEGNGEIIFAQPPGAVMGREAPPRESYVAGWLMAQRSMNTVDAYRRDVREFFAWCDGLPVDVFAVARIHVDAYRHTLERFGRTDSTVARKLTAVSSFYTYVVLEAPERMGSNPALRAKRPDVSQDSNTARLEPEEVEGLLVAVEEIGHREAAVVRMLLTVGLRVSEACSANVTDLGSDRGHRTITVIRKGGKRQRLAVPPNTYAVLARYLDGRASGPLFLSRTGQRLGRRQVWEILDAARGPAGIDPDKRISAHVLRHTCATDALDAGATLRDVQTMMGHVDSRTTNRYDRTRHNLDRSPSHRIDRPLPAAMRGTP